MTAEVAFPDLAIAGEDSDPPEQPTPPPPSPADEEDDPDLPEMLEDDYDDDDDDEGGGGNGSSQIRPPPRRSGRENRGVPPLRYDDVFEAAIDLTCPETVKEALGGDNAEKWAEAMDKELESPWKNKVYVEVEGPC